MHRHDNCRRNNVYYNYETNSYMDLKKGDKFLLCKIEGEERFHVVTNGISKLEALYALLAISDSIFEQVFGKSNETTTNVFDRFERNPQGGVSIEELAYKMANKDESE